MNKQMNSSFEESVEETENLIFFGKKGNRCEMEHRASLSRNTVCVTW